MAKKPENLQDSILLEDNIMGSVIPGYNSYPYQQEMEQQIIANDEFLKAFKEPGFVDEQKNLILSNYFSDTLGESPYAVNEEGKHTYNSNVKWKSISDTDTPEVKAASHIWNQLKRGKGGIVGPSAMTRLFAKSMTGQWLDFLGGPDLLFQDFAMSKDGFTYKGQSLKLDKEEERVIYDFMQKVSGEDEEKTFLEKIGETAASLTMDLPLLIATGGIAGGIMKGSTVLSTLARSTGFIPRVLGQVVQQTINFNLLGLPTTVKSMSNSFDDGMSAIWDNTKMGMLASVTGTLGAKTADATKHIPGIKNILSSKPALRQELGGIMGSFGFGYTSEKMLGESDIDALAHGLAFAATHFTNPHAYSKVLREQKNKNLMILTESIGKEDAFKTQPDYFLKKDNKLIKIDRQAFKDKGDIIPLDVNPIDITSNVASSIKPYNTLMDSYTNKFYEELGSLRQRKREQELFKRFTRDNTQEWVDANRKDIAALSRLTAASLNMSELTKIFGKWKLPDDAKLTNEMIKLAENISAPYHVVKKIASRRLRDYVENPEKTLLEIRDSGLIGPAQKQLEKVLETAKESVVNEAKRKDPFIFSTADVDNLLEYHKLQLGKAEPEDIGSIVYHTERIQDLSKIATQRKEDKSVKKKEYQPPTIDAVANTELLAEINRLKDDMTREQILQANKRALKALEQPEKTTAEALYGKEGSIKKTQIEESPVKVEEKSLENEPKSKDSSIEKAGSMNENKPIDNITPKEETQPASNKEELIPEKYTTESSSEVINKEASKVDMKPENLAIYSLQDSGLGRRKIAQTLQEKGYYKELTPQQIDDKVSNTLRRKPEYDKYEQWKKDKPELERKEEVIPEEEQVVEEPIAKESKQMFDEENQVFEKGNEGQEVSSVVNVRNPEDKRVVNTLESAVNRLSERLDKLGINLLKPGGLDKARQVMESMNMSKGETALDVLIDRAAGDNRPLEDYTGELYQKKGESKYKELSESEVQTALDDMQKEMNRLGAHFKAVYDKGLDKRGLVSFTERVLKLSDKATEDTPYHEWLHMAVGALGEQRNWERFLKNLGWDGKGSYLDPTNQTLRKAHEELASQYADFALGHGPDTSGLFYRIKQLFERTANWLRGAGFQSKHDYFRKLVNGELRGDVQTEPVGAFYSDLRESNSVDKLLKDEFAFWKDADVNIDANADMKAFLNKASSDSFTRSAVNLYRMSATPPAFMKYFSPRFNAVREPIEKGLVRGVPLEINRIIKDPNGWNDGKLLRTLPKEQQEGLVEAVKQLRKSIYDGEFPEKHTPFKFVKAFDLTPEQGKVWYAYQDAIKKTREVAKDGLKNRVIKFNNSVATSLLNDKDIANFFKPNDPTEINVYRKDGSVDYKAVDRIINEDMAFKEEIADYIAGKVYDVYDNVNYVNDVRPSTPDTWVIEGSRPSTNRNHEQQEDGSYIERISTYAEPGLSEVLGLPPGLSKKDRAIKSKDKIVSELKEQGYNVKAYRIGDILGTDQFWDKLTTRQLTNLVNQGHIPLTDEVVQKLFASIKSGTFEEHGIKKKWVPGMHNTLEELETNLHRFVASGVNSKYRQNSVLESREFLRKWKEHLDSSIKEGKYPADYELQKQEYNYAVKYFNNVTHSDNTAIDAYRNVVNTFYTALKGSFLTQQAMQGLQTTWHLARGEGSIAKTSGDKAFAEGTMDAFKLGYDRIAKKNRERITDERIKPEDDLTKLIQDLDDMNLLGQTYIQEMFGSGGDISNHYAFGAQKYGSRARKLMNMMSAGIERFTRIQSASTFYRIGKSKGLTGNELTSWVADKINETMSQWGVAGRPPIAASSIVGKSASAPIKTLEKSFFTFKTFATHNLGLYEYLMRNKMHGALASKLFVGMGIHGITKFPFLATAFAVANLFTDDDLDYELMSLLDEVDQTTGTKIGTMFGRGVPAGLGIDMSRLMDERSAFATDILSETQSRTAPGMVAEAMMGAPYGFTSDLVDVAGAMKDAFLIQVGADDTVSDDEKKRIRKNLMKISPLMFRNIVNALNMNRDGVELRGQTIIKRDDLSWSDVFYKALGFNPTDINRQIEEEIKGFPAKFKRVEGRIREIKKIRKEISTNKGNKYTAPERASQLIEIASMLREALREKARMMSTSEYRNMIKKQQSNRR